MGAAVDVVTAYRTVTGGADGESVTKMLVEGEIDVVTFTSSSTVTNLLALIGEQGKTLLAGVKIACIGPVTADTCREQGLHTDIIATEYTIPGLTESILRELGGRTHE